MKQFTLVALLLLTLVSCTPTEEITIAEGTLEAQEVTVSAEGNGRLLSFDVTEGSEVTEGVIIGKIDDTQLTLQRSQVIATRERVESQKPDIDVQLASLEEQLATAKTEEERFTRLVAASAASQKQLDDISSQVRTLTLQLNAQRQTLEKSTQGLESESASLTYQISRLDDQIAKSEIASPLNGTVIATYAEAGEFTAVGKPLFKVADLDHMFLRAYITSGQLTTLALGDTLKVMIDYGTDESRIYEGKLSWISDTAEFTPKTVQTRDERASLVYAVKVSLVNDGYLKLGMYGAIVEDR